MIGELYLDGEPFMGVESSEMSDSSTVIGASVYKKIYPLDSTRTATLTATLTPEDTITFDKYSAIIKTIPFISGWYTQVKASKKGRTNKKWAKRYGYRLKGR